VLQSEPALARLTVQPLGMHEPMSLSGEADQNVPSDEDVSQASMVAVLWLLSYQHSWPECVCHSYGGFCA